MPVSFNVLAERELNEAAQYYESEQAGLCAAFLLDVRPCMDTQELEKFVEDKVQ